METKKITHEEALRRWKHSLEVKREWEREVAERWANEDQQKISTIWSANKRQNCSQAKSHKPYYVIALLSIDL